MRVSLRSTYGIMAAVDLAIQERMTPIQAKSIAKRQGIPARFLEQVLHAMKKAGLVTSLRGSQGGYVLSKKPSDMSVADILEALEGSSVPIAGATVRHSSKSDRLLSQVWNRVYQAEKEVLSAITVEELANQHRQIEQQRTLMYHI